MLACTQMTFQCRWCVLLYSLRQVPNILVLLVVSILHYSLLLVTKFLILFLLVASLAILISNKYIQTQLISINIRRGDMNTYHYQMSSLSSLYEHVSNFDFNQVSIYNHHSQLWFDIYVHALLLTFWRILLLCC